MSLSSPLRVEASAARPRLEQGSAMMTSEPEVTDDARESTAIETALLRIAESLDGVVTVGEIRELTDEELVGLTRSAAALARKIATLETVSAREVQRRSTDRSGGNLAAKFGCRNEVELLQRTTRESAQDVRRRLRLGELLQPNSERTGDLTGRKHPLLETAFQNGDLSVDTAQVIADTLSNAPRNAPAPALVAAEQSLVSAATGMTAEHHDGVRALARAWSHTLHSEGKLGDAEIMDRRGLRLGKQRDGLIPISGALLPTTAALLQDVMDAINSPRALANGAGAGTDQGSRVKFEAASNNEPGAATAADHRTPDQKRHDAFTAMLGVAAKHADVPASGGAPVTVLLQVTATKPGPQGEANALNRDGWVYGNDGPEPETAEAIRHAACVGAIQRVVQDDRGRLIELGTPQRVFNAHQRKAITLRDGGCVIPGCTVPARWCEIHHVHERARGGKTHTDNGVLMCFYHHRSLETSGWSVRMESGVPHVRVPKRLDPRQRWKPVQPRTKPPNTS